MGSDKMASGQFEFFTAYDISDPHARTKKFVLQNNRTSDTLGYIEWYGRWRQFCFMPTEGTVWSDGCLADVRTLIGELAAERRNKQ